MQLYIDLAHLVLDKMAAILTDDIFKCIFFNEIDRIPSQISLKFVPKSPNDNKPALVQVMAWRRTITWQATSHYLNQWWPGSSTHTCGIRGVVLDSKVHGANMGPIWGRQDPGGPHVGPMNLAIWGTMVMMHQLFSTCRSFNIFFRGHWVYSKSKNK